MPNFRQTRNTYYNVQIEQIRSSELESLKVEEGAVIEVEGIIYIGINGVWEQLYLNVGQQLGWGRFDDTQYNAGSPYIFSTNTEFIIPNNAGSVLTAGVGADFYDGSKIRANFKNDTFLITVAFKAYIDSSNEHAEVYLYSAGTTPYSRVKNVIVFPKGNGIEHEYALTFQYYADSDLVLNGIDVRMKASTSGAIYDVIYFIQQVQRYG